MDARGIKGFMGLRGEGPNDITRAISTQEEPEHVSEVSRVLSCKRRNKRIEDKIANFWNLDPEELWDALRRSLPLPAEQRARESQGSESRAGC